jgi:hypothetical protein
MIIEIISGLYICDTNEYLDLNIYKKYDINVLFNCSLELPFVKNKNTKIENVRVPILNIDSLLKNKEKILNYLKNNYLEKNILLIGDSNYNLIIISLFLIKYGNISYINIKEIFKNIDNSLCIDFDFSTINI